MKISGNYMIDAPREQVWDALNDIDVLARVVPGCQRLEQTGENQFEGTVKIGIQTIRGTYDGRIRLEDVQPPQHYKLVAHGKSSNGIVDGTGTVDLEEQDGKTLLKYGGEANVAGTLASVGQRLIEGAAKQMINQSLKALVEQINKRAAGETDDDDSTPDAVTPDQKASEQTKSQPAASSNKPAASVSNGTPASGASKPVPASMIGQAATSSVTAARAPRPKPATPASASGSTANANAQASAPAQPPESPQSSQSSFQSRSVVVPEDEQLKPETVALGMAQDFFSERPWIPWVVVAFLLGFILGRAGN